MQAERELLSQGAHVSAVVALYKSIGGVQVRNVIAPEKGRMLIVFTNDEGVDFGEVWQGKGLSHDLLSAALCAE